LAGKARSGGLTSGRRSGPDPVATTRKIRGRVAKKRRIRLFLIFFLLLLAALAVAWFVWLRDLPVFEIRDVQVTGLEAIESDDGEGEAATLVETVTTSLNGMTTVHVRKDDLLEALEPYPRVAGVEVETDFPNGATARLELREDGAVVGDGDQAVVVASDGTLLGPVGDDQGNLPRLAGDPPSDDRTVLGGPRLSQAIVLGATPAELRPFVNGSRMGEKGIEVELSNGLILVFGDDSKPGAKWKAAATVIADPELVDAGTIDLTVPWRPAVESGSAPAEAGSEVVDQ